MIKERKRWLNRNFRSNLWYPLLLVVLPSPLKKVAVGGGEDE